jgi:hypothetical protein
VPIVPQSDRDELVLEIERLQGLLEDVERRLASAATPPEDGAESRGSGPLLQARVDEAYAQLEIAKRVPAADAWQAIQKATDAVRRFRDSSREEAVRYSGPLVRLTLFASASGPSLRALAAVDAVLRRLGDRVSLELCDVSRHPERAEQAGVVFTPVLRVERAGRDPVTIFGALDDRVRLIARLAGAGLPVESDPSVEPTAGEGALSVAAPTAGRD